jgi:hypothetical protein
MNWSYYVAIAITVALSITSISLYATLIPKDSAQNTKILTTISVCSFAASLAAYGLALWHFSSNPQYMIHFLLAITMLVLLPSALIATSVSTVTISNLRDTLATAQSSG